MKIPITDRFDSATSSGGTTTPERDAGEALEEVNETRVDEVETQQQQQAGEVGNQNEDLKPSSGNPGEGLPSNPSGAENTGGSDENATEAEETVESVKAAYEDRLLRLAAEFENYKRLAARRESEVRERAVRGVFEDLLPVLDNFQRAVQAAQNATNVDSLRIGVEYILQQLEDSLREHGVEPIAAKGEKFDPLRHDALEEVAQSDQEAGTIIEEVQKGYSYKGNVLRAARVRVAG
jgi:molecular chaperone GrpE